MKVVKILVYVDTFVVVQMNIAKVQTAIKILEKEFAALQNEMKKYLTELMNGYG